MWKNRLVLLVIAIAIVSLGGALALSGAFQSLQYRQEWVRALLQVGAIAVLGIVTSAVLEQFKDDLQRRRDNSKLRLEALKELTRAYMDVKLVRRKGQASKAFSEEQTDALNRSQVTLETLKHTSCRLFRRRSKELEGHLSVMEKYLNHATNNPESPERSGFLAKGFKPFSVAFHCTKDLMLREITD